MQKLWKNFLEAVSAGDFRGIHECIQAILVRLETGFWNDPSTKTASIKMMRKICDTLFAHRYFDQLVQFSAEGSTHKAIAQTDTMKHLAGAWFICESMRYIGESIDQSITFALYLLEQVGTWHQELSKKFELADRMDGLAQTIQSQCFIFIKTSAFLPICHQLPTRRWLDCIIRHVTERPDASEVMSSILSCVASMDKHLVSGIIQPMRSPEHEALYKAIAQSNDAELIETILKTPVIHVTEAQSEVLRIWGDRRRKENDEANAKGRLFLEGFAQQAKTIRERTKKRLDEACQNPTHGLRTNGDDHIEIRVMPLVNIGIRGIIFRPENRELSDPVIEIVTRKETPHLISYRVTLQHPDPVILEAIVWNGIHNDYELLIDLLKTVIEDSYARIVLHERHLKSPSQKTSDGISDSANGALRSVRPRIRHLPTGTHASEEAIGRCIETFGYEPPQGRTFVRAYSYKGRITYDLPTAPFVVYRDDDMLDLIQGENHHDSEVMQSA